MGFLYQPICLPVKGMELSRSRQREELTIEWIMAVKFPRQGFWVFPCCSSIPFLPPASCPPPNSHDKASCMLAYLEPIISTPRACVHKSCFILHDAGGRAWFLGCLSPAPPHFWLGGRYTCKYSFTAASQPVSTVYTHTPGLV